MAGTDISTPPSSRAEDALLSPDFVRKLDRLDVVSRKVLAGKLHGERRSKKRGRSVEFADYRPYVAGDDLRFVDWNLYARLDRFFLRLFMEEEDLSVSILLDVSRSMDFGDPDKLLYGKRLAAALAYISLTHNNRVHLYSFAGGLEDQIANLRGRRPVQRVLAFLRAQGPRGAGDLAEACRRFALTQRQKGVVVMVSDLLDKGELADALRYLTPKRYDAYVIQLLSPQEIDPAGAQVVGDLRLVDMEDDDVTDVSANPSLLKRYRATLQAYCEHARHQCARRGVVHMLCDTAVPFQTVVLTYLRQRRLLT